ncbi:MAG: glycosyltransferase [Flavobacteriaceae bacterium]|nr:glycosyltransferase [Flavobacteriaceae bacterium]
MIAVRLDQSVLYPKVAVLLAAYNGVNYIQQQLESILNQVEIDIKIFISVDVSTDNTFGLCKELAGKQHEISILPYGERFGGAAANFFRLIRDVDFSGFDYVALADQDDIWLEDKLTTACQQIERRGVDAYSSNVLAFWENGKEFLINKAQGSRQYDHFFEAAGPGCTYVLSTKPLLIFKKQMQLQQHLMAKVALHDWLLYAFFRTNNFKWFIDSDYKMLYRQHNDNQVGVNRGWSAFLKRFRLFTSGWYRQQVEIIMGFTGASNPDFHSRIILLKNCNQLRRACSDRIVLFFFILFGLY